MCAGCRTQHRHSKVGSRTPMWDKGRIWTEPQKAMSWDFPMAWESLGGIPSKGTAQSTVSQRRWPLWSNSGEGIIRKQTADPRPRTEEGLESSHSGPSPGSVTGSKEERKRTCRL